MGLYALPVSLTSSEDNRTIAGHTIELTRCSVQSQADSGFPLLSPSAV